MKLGSHRYFDGRRATLIRETTRYRVWRYIDGGGDFKVKYTEKRCRAKRHPVVSREAQFAAGLKAGFGYDEILAIIGE